MQICSISWQIGTALMFPLESLVRLIVHTLFSSMDTARYTPLLCSYFSLDESSRSFHVHVVKHSIADAAGRIMDGFVFRDQIRNELHQAALFPPHHSFTVGIRDHAFQWLVRRDWLQRRISSQFVARPWQHKNRQALRGGFIAQMPMLVAYFPVMDASMSLSMYAAV